jgi:hypothetical protein
VRRPKSPPPARVTADDEFANTLREECARAGAKWLKESVNIQRPIGTLKLPEMCGLAEAITARWIVLVSQRAAAPEVTESDRDRAAFIG